MRSTTYSLSAKGPKGAIRLTAVAGRTSPFAGDGVIVMPGCMSLSSSVMSLAAIIDSEAGHVVLSLAYLLDGLTP